MKRVRFLVIARRMRSCASAAGCLVSTAFYSMAILVTSYTLYNPYFPYESIAKLDLSLVNKAV